jgi:hypothetical protein
MHCQGPITLEGNHKEMEHVQQTAVNSGYSVTGVPETYNKRRKKSNDEHTTQRNARKNGHNSHFLTMIVES